MCVRPQPNPTDLERARAGVRAATAMAQSAIAKADAMHAATCTMIEVVLAMQSEGRHDDAAAVLLATWRRLKSDNLEPENNLRN